MSRHWKERFDPERHTDWMSSSSVGGSPRRAPLDRLVEEWTYFVHVCDFTFEFASLDQLDECLEYCRQRIRPSSMEAGVTLEHYWQRWHERLPKGLLGGTKRERVVKALERARIEFRR